MALSTSSSEPSLPSIEGWLDKQGGLRKSWKRRYFVLEGKRLKYFKQQKDAPHRPINTINLERTCKVIYVRDKVRPTDPVAGCGFAIETANRTYILAANSMPERDKWAAHLQMALSTLYGLPKPVVLLPKETPTPPSATSRAAAPSSGTRPVANSGSVRYSRMVPETTQQENSSPQVLTMEPTPMIDDYDGSNGTVEQDRSKSASLDLFNMAMNGLSAINPINAVGLGRRDEVEALREELLRKDGQLEAAERKCKVLERAYADLAEKYFVSVAVFAKMNAVAQGYYCNTDVYALYADAKRLQIDPQQWPHWVTLQIQQNISRIRT